MALLQFNLKRPKTVDYWNSDSKTYDAYRKQYDAWASAWKAKRIANGIEIRKAVGGANAVVTVRKPGPDRSVPDDEKPIVYMSLNGTAVLSQKDWDELNQAIAEAKAML